MKTKLYLLLILLVLQIHLKGQNIPDQVDLVNIEHAKLIDADVQQFFASNTSYPQKAAINEIEGNVVVSFIISKNGQIDSIQIVNNPNNILAVEVLVALEKSYGLWIPCKVNGNAVDKKYLGCFKFLMSKASVFTDNRNKGIKNLQKGDYEKSLKYINKALTIDEYNSELYQARANVYLKMNEMN
ncbi:MAG: TonB family protein [Draconibacterium sp.]|nr:TonB family protein [Draconibacterium sp.]